MEAPRYRVLELSLIGNELVEPGREIANYDGYPSGNLEPLNEAAKAKADELVEINKQRIRDMQAANPFSATLDPEALGNAIAAGIAQAMAAQSAEQADLNARLAVALEALAAGAPAQAPALTPEAAPVPGAPTFKDTGAGDGAGASAAKPAAADAVPAAEKAK